MADKERVLQGLGPRHPSIPLQLLQETDSTNLRLKEGLREGVLSAPCLMIAESQTAGRGRLGRAFISPPGTGLYMSLLYRPEGAWDPGRITILAAVAVCRAVEEATGLQPGIKWVNDLFLRGKKICGILAEATLEHVIIGIGLNLRTPPGGFPEAAGPAGALDTNVDRLLLAGKIAGYLLDGLQDLSHPAIIQGYRQRMFLTGREIQYRKNGEQKNALVTGVDDTGGLMIRDAQGDHILRTGEVSLGSASLSRLE